MENASEAIALDPFRESSYGLLMEVHHATGNRAEALRVYQRLQQVLAAGLGADPAPETQERYLKLLK